jgi:hypothetical protein
MTTGTMNGIPLERATVRIPAWGVGVLDCVTLSGEQQAGAVQVVLGGQTFTGTVASGGVYRDRGTYRVALGAGRWGRIVEGRAYANAAGVKLSAVARDAALDAGETLGAVDERRLGPQFVRPSGPAARALDLVAPEGWHVGLDGVTNVRPWAESVYSAPVTLIDYQRAAAHATLAAESLAGLVPGAVFRGGALGGVKVGTVRHELTPTALRTHITAAVYGLADRTMDAIRRVVQAVTRPHWYHGAYEYRVQDATSGYLALSPADRASGLPELGNVPMRVGVPGGGGDPAEGSTVLVGFVNGDPTRPYVLSYEGEGTDGWVPDVARLTASGRVYVGGSEVANPLAIGRFLRTGDVVQFTGASPMLPATPYTVVVQSGTMAKAGSS